MVMLLNMSPSTMFLFIGQLSSLYQFCDHNNLIWQIALQLVRRGELAEPVQAAAHVVEPSEANVEYVDESGKQEIENNAHTGAQSDERRGHEQALGISHEADVVADHVQQPTDQLAETKVPSMLYYTNKKLIC